MPAGQEGHSENAVRARDGHREAVDVYLSPEATGTGRRVHRIRRVRQPRAGYPAERSPLRPVASPLSGRGAGRVRASF